MRYVEKYDISIAPPQSFLKMGIVNPITNVRLEERAYVDTGFSGSLIITKNVYEKLKLGLIEVDEEYYAIHAGHFITKLKPVIAIVEIGEFYHARKRIFVHPYIDRILVGRDILNELHICLNGPKRILELRG